MFTYQFKLNPSKETQDLLWRHANRLNFLYNYFLNQRIQNYKEHKENPSVKLISKYDQIKEITLLKTQEEFKDLKEIYSQNIQVVPDRLNKSYDNFFRRYKKGLLSGFPKFRSCRKFFGILYPQSGYKIKGNVFETKIYGKIEFIKYREIKGNILQVYISNKNNTFYINIITDYNYPKNSTSNIFLGIDVGIKNLVVGKDSNGSKIIIKNATHTKYFNKQIDKLKSRRDKLPKKEDKTKSREYKRLNKVIQKLSDVENRKTKDFQHKVSKKLSSQYDTIFVENINIKKMSESDKTSLNKYVRYTKLGQFLRYLEYKTFRVIKVNPFNTSKTCNKCGYIHKDLKLSDRYIKCVCGHEYDRDENASANIYCLGQAILNGCTVDTNINKLISAGSPSLKGGVVHTTKIVKT